MISFDIVVAFLFLLCCDIIAHSVQAFWKEDGKTQERMTLEKRKYFLEGIYGTQMEKTDWIL